MVPDAPERRLAVRGLLLVIGHFALPFALLLSRDLKRNFKLLRRIAIFIIVHAHGGYVLAGRPGFPEGRFGMSWMDCRAARACSASGWRISSCSWRSAR